MIQMIITIKILTIMISTIIKLIRTLIITFIILMKMVEAVIIIKRIIFARFIIKFNYELFVGRIQPISHHIFLSNGRERITTA